MSASKISVRFAPSPTGIMHLGNIRAALINYLFARQKQGTFIIRIEDTDAQRNTDFEGRKILSDLHWLHLSYDEGPDIGGPHAPYLQSQRSEFYQKHLKELQTNNHVYRCFCTVEELEKKRQRQIALKMPPRYDRICTQLSNDAIEKKLAEHVPFIWRFKLPQGTVTVHDLARGAMEYDLKNFSDFPLTRADGSFTFVFANFVDDLMMHITHIFRGEEHLSSTALQAALYQTYRRDIPTFWHLPIICNSEGKKLSKRDFGFSLDDLKKDGLLPEAIINYLAIIGATFEQEVMSLDELVHAVNFEKQASAGFIHYDVEKLLWFNHKWIQRLHAEQIAERCRPLLQAHFPHAQTTSTLELARIIQPLRDEFVTLNDCVEITRFYFEQPRIDKAALENHMFTTYKPALQKLVAEYEKTANPDEFDAAMKLICKDLSLKPSHMFALIRIALTGKPHGPSIIELLKILSHEEVIARLNALINA